MPPWRWHRRDPDSSGPGQVPTTDVHRACGHECKRPHLVLNPDRRVEPSDRAIIAVRTVPGVDDEPERTEEAGQIGVGHRHLLDLGQVHTRLRQIATFGRDQRSHDGGLDRPRGHPAPSVEQRLEAVDVTGDHHPYPAGHQYGRQFRRVRHLQGQRQGVHTSASIRRPHCRRTQYSVGRDPAAPEFGLQVRPDQSRIRVVGAGFAIPGDDDRKSLCGQVPQRGVDVDVGDIVIGAGKVDGEVAVERLHNGGPAGQRT